MTCFLQVQNCVVDAIGACLRFSSRLTHAVASGNSTAKCAGPAQGCERMGAASGGLAASASASASVSVAMGRQAPASTSKPVASSHSSAPTSSA